MRELAVKLRFTAHCLGNVKRQRRQGGKIRHYFVLPRNADRTQIVFMPTWWQSTLKRSAQILCRHQRDVLRIRFAPEVRGTPRPIPEKLYNRYHARGQFSRHEAFYPGDEVVVTCVVPPEIGDDDFLKLMRYAGKYFGISPSQPNDYGFYEVVWIHSVSDHAKKNEVDSHVSVESQPSREEDEPFQLSKKEKTANRS